MQGPGDIRQRFDVSNIMHPFELGTSSNQPEQVRPDSPNQPEPLMGTGQTEEGNNDFADTDLGDNFVDFNEEIKQETTTFEQAPIQNIAAMAATPEQPKMSRKALKKIRYNQFKFYKSLGLQPPMKMPKKDPTGVSDTIRDVPPKQIRGTVGGNLGRTQYKSAFRRMRPYLGKEGITHISENKAYCELCKREFNPKQCDGSNSDLHFGDFVHLMNLLKAKFPEEAKKHEAAFNTAMEPNCDHTKVVQVKRQLLMAVQEATKEIRHERNVQETAKANEEGGQEDGATDQKANAQNNTGTSGVNKPSSTVVQKTGTSSTVLQKTGTPANPGGQAGKTTNNTSAKPGQGKPNQVRPQGNAAQNQPRPNVIRPGVRPTRPIPNMIAGIRGQQPFAMPRQLPGWPNFPQPQQLRMHIRSPFSSTTLGIAALNQRNLLVAQRLGLRTLPPTQLRLQNNEASPLGTSNMDIGGNLPNGPVINRLRNLASSGTRKRPHEDNEGRQEGPQQFYDVEQPYDEWHNPEHVNKGIHDNHRGGPGPGPNAPPSLMSVNAGNRPGPDVAAKRRALLMTLDQLRTVTAFLPAMAQQPGQIQDAEVAAVLQNQGEVVHQPAAPNPAVANEPAPNNGDSLITNKEEADIASRISFSLNKALNSYYKRQECNHP